MSSSTFSFVRQIKNDYSIKIPNSSNSRRFRCPVCTAWLAVTATARSIARSTARRGLLRPHPPRTRGNANTRIPIHLQPISLSQSLVISHITLVMRSYQNSAINLSDGPGPLPRPHCSNALQLHLAPNSGMHAAIPARRYECWRGCARMPCAASDVHARLY